MSDAVRLLADRLAADPRFLAHPLAEYARSEGLDEAALAARLGCRPDDLPLVRLCQSPRADEFRADVTAVATRYGIDPETLAQAVKRGQGLAETREAVRRADGASFLMAARDDDRPAGEPTP
jgi:hypothetical protein